MEQFKVLDLQMHFFLNLKKRISVSQNTGTVNFSAKLMVSLNKSGSRISDTSARN